MSLLYKVKIQFKKHFPQLYLRLSIRRNCGFFSRKQYLNKIEKSFPKIISYYEMLDLMKQGASLSRFGDGEFGLILGKGTYFQKYDPLLKNKLISTLKRGASNKLLVSIPIFRDNPEGVKRFLNNKYNFWQIFWLRYYRKLSVFFCNKYYGNSFISRDTAFHHVSLEYYRNIWEGRTVVFVIPKDGHFIFDNRVFGNIKSPSFVYIPPKNAFSNYNEILNQCLKFKRDVLFIISAGPTATILSAELSDLGFQALDLGHLSNCYKQYLGESLSPEIEYNYK